MTMCMPILGLAQDVLIRDAIVTPYLWLKAAENLYKIDENTVYARIFSEITYNNLLKGTR